MILNWRLRGLQNLDKCPKVLASFQAKLQPRRRRTSSELPRSARKKTPGRSVSKTPVPLRSSWKYVDTNTGHESVLSDLLGNDVPLSTTRRETKRVKEMRLSESPALGLPGLGRKGKGERDGNGKFSGKGKGKGKQEERNSDDIEMEDDRVEGDHSTPSVRRATKFEELRTSTSTSTPTSMIPPLKKLGRPTNLERSRRIGSQESPSTSGPFVPPKVFIILKAHSYCF